MSQIKREFIKGVLRNEGIRIEDAQVRAINKLLKFRTGRLESNRSYKVAQVGNAGAELQIIVPIYERFLDMGAKTRKGSGNVQTFNSKDKLKKFPIHNSIIFAHLNRIAFKINFGLTQDVIKSIKDNIEKNG
jgi:hypothetical protein